MGQYWVLVNLDKKQKSYWSKFGEFYLRMGLSAYLCDPDAQSSTSWAGDRLILVGDYAKDIPAGIAEDNDTQDMFTYNVDEADSAGTSHHWGGYYRKTSVLRNLCTREYIRADLFPDRDSSHPGLGEVILPKIVWSSDSSMSMGAEVDPRGPWAGARFDIVHEDIVKDDKEWKDITEVEFFNYYTMWSSDMGKVDQCTCVLCQKYRDEHEAFYKILNRPQKSQNPDRAHEMAVERTSPKDGSVSHAPHPSRTNSLSVIEILPAELHEEIMTHLAVGDLAACAATSKTLSLEATKRLYTSVTLERATQTKTLLDTISRRPELTSYIKDLRLVMMAHWESLLIAHGILKQLPALKSLDFAPCWFSYGNLPYWEYPFTLRTLRWGLKQDSAFHQFCESQPGVQVSSQDPYDKGKEARMILSWVRKSRAT